MAVDTEVPARAVVPAAGLGQRLRPITRVLPKEMFPIGHYPAIEWVISEAIASGCTDVAVVISPGKRIIQEYLTTCCPDLMERCRLTFLVQPEPLGLGHALWLAHEFCGGYPFAVLLPDDLMVGQPLALQQMAPVFETTGGAVFAITQEPAENAHRYGRLELSPVDERVYRVTAILPRTTPARARMQFVGVGRYLFSPECLGHVAMLLDQPRTGELDDGLLFQYMLDIGEPVHGVHITGSRFDISTPEGYIAAWQHLGKASLFE
ncbi:MAG: UTP--glucose-1-phosphate uridylyltransferase BpsC [Anaerolineae bacterium]